MFAQCLFILLSALAAYILTVIAAICSLVEIQVSTKRKLLAEKKSLELSDRIALSVLIHTAIFILFVVSLKHHALYVPVDMQGLAVSYMWIACNSHVLGGVNNPFAHAVNSVLENAVVYALFYAQSAGLLEKVLSSGAVLGWIRFNRSKLGLLGKNGGTVPDAAIGTFVFLCKRLLIEYLVGSSDRCLLKSLYMIEGRKNIGNQEQFYLSVVLLQTLHLQEAANCLASLLGRSIKPAGIRPGPTSINA
ncbi:uncharacterized protein NEMAJ01_1418 [Nematocida major]|uniref:uncharacterized protein n=1 Tax=Nematocida major TaxID=1912982 RepID=UPI0020086E95|nr:uncharacterized protein NEMAJ01_1418 [Nematocida major]KAH9386522.1 hypothetical protein NEMAJ01_1418 [Nematocida major]